MAISSITGTLFIGRQNPEHEGGVVPTETLVTQRVECVTTRILSKIDKAPVLAASQYMVQDEVFDFYGVKSDWAL